MLRKAIGAVKDFTSVGVAKMSSAQEIEVLILKATSHDEIPMGIELLNRIIQLGFRSSANAAACGSAIRRRLDRTQDWIVALKCLNLVHHILRHKHGTFFAQYAPNVVGYVFCKKSIRKNSWEVVRTLASYLNERIHTTIFNYGNKLDLKDLKGLLERMKQWERLLQRTRVMAPSERARKSELVRDTLESVVLESAEGYREVRKGMEVVAYIFPNMEKEECMEAMRICMVVSEQLSEDLLYFFESCMGNKAHAHHIRPFHPSVMSKLDGYLRKFEEASGSHGIGQP